MAHQVHHQQQGRVEEVKEAMQETYEKGKGTLQSMTKDTGNSLLSGALLIHALINLVQGAILLYNPAAIAGSFLGEMKLAQAPWVLTRCFAFQTLVLGAISGGAVFKYDVKHKYYLNMILLGFHLLMVWDMYSKHWYDSSGFRFSPAYFHGPMAGFHALALMLYKNPQLISNAKAKYT